MQMPYAYLYLIPTDSPTVYFPFITSEMITGGQNACSQALTDDKPINKLEQFLRLFEQELKKTSIKYMKKVWTKEDDKLLLQLKKQGFRWTQISEKIQNSNPQICKRRYMRLKEDEKKWPVQLEEEIKKVCQTLNLKWQQKMKILQLKFPQIRNYSKKMIKERYLTYLESSIEQRAWTVEQDMMLIKLIQKGVKRWKSIAKAIPGRSELHLKNRYYGCLRNIKRKVQKKFQKWN